MRTVTDIDREIAATEAHLSALHAERRAALANKNDDIIADFDGGLSIRDIASARLMRYATVQGILWRAGRTEKGRAATRERIAQAIHAGAPA